MNWDYSFVNHTDSVTAHYTIVTSTPYDMYFPTANYIVYDGDLFTYYFWDDGEYTFLGNKGAEVSNIMDDPLTYYLYPFGYGDSFTDDFQTEGSVAATHSSEYVGYGTLQTPVGTYDNAVLIHVEETLDMTPVDEYYEFITPVTQRAIFLYFIEPGLPFGARAYFKDDGAATAVQNILKEKYAVSVSPDPAQNYAEITFSVPQQENVSVTLLSVDGKVSRKISEALFPSGKNIIPLDLTGIPAGNYLVRLVIGDTPVVEKIVVQ